MGTATMRRAGAGDAAAVTAAYAAATADEAVNAWVMGAGEVAPELLEAHFSAYVAAAVERDEVWLAGGGGEVWTVSVWVRVDSAERLEADAEEVAAAAEEHGLAVLERAALVARTVAAAHPRVFPHLHLHSIATVPWRRGEGAGAALLAERLRLADEEGLPVYLEASTARSARLYERAGFAAAGASIALPGGGPELVPMWRR